MWVIIFLALLLVALASIWQRTDPLTAGRELITGIVETPPDTLASQAGLDRDTYSLARVGQSEEGTSSDLAKIAVMYCTKNQAAKLGISVTTLITRTGWVDSTNHALGRKFPNVDGKYSRQEYAKYASSITPPTDGTKALAVQVMQGQVDDPTGGCRKFDNPKTQDYLHSLNPTKYQSSADIAAKRQSEGLTLVQLDGVTTRFWRA